MACIQLSHFGVWASLKLCCAGVLLLSCAVPGEVLSSCGVETPVLLHRVVWLFSRCSFLAHLWGLMGVCGASSLDVVYELAPL